MVTRHIASGAKRVGLRDSGTSGHVTPSDGGSSDVTSRDVPRMAVTLAGGGQSCWRGVRGCSGRRGGSGPLSSYALAMRSPVVQPGARGRGCWCAPLSACRAISTRMHETRVCVQFVLGIPFACDRLCRVCAMLGTDIRGVVLLDDGNWLVESSVDSRS
eukprot:135624-Rhodomonas_salina.2